MKGVLRSLEDLPYKSSTIKKNVSSNGWYEAWGMNVCGALRPWYEKVLQKFKVLLLWHTYSARQGNIKGFLFPAGSVLSWGTVGGWWLLSGTGDDRGVKALTSLAELLWAPSRISQGLSSSLVHTHPVTRENLEMKTESSDTWLMEALRQGLSLVTGTLGNNWYKLPQTLKAAGPPSHWLFLGPIRWIKWHQN